MSRLSCPQVCLSFVADAATATRLLFLLGAAFAQKLAFHGRTLGCFDAAAAVGCEGEAADGADWLVEVLFGTWQTDNFLHAQAVRRPGNAGLRCLEAKVAAYEPDLADLSLALICHHAHAHVVVHIIDGDAASVRDAEELCLFAGQTLDVIKVASEVGAEEPVTDLRSHDCVFVVVDWGYVYVCVGVRALTERVAS